MKVHTKHTDVDSALRAFKKRLMSDKKIRDAVKSFHNQPNMIRARKEAEKIRTARREKHLKR